MIRNMSGIAVVLVLATVAFKFFAALLGGILSIVMTLLLWGVIAFAAYTVLKIFFPDTAAKVKSSVSGDSSSTA